MRSLFATTCAGVASKLVQKPDAWLHSSPLTRMSSETPTSAVSTAGEAQPHAMRRLRRMAYRLIPLPVHTINPLIFETKLLLTRLRSRGARRSFEGTQGLMVNIGPGPNGLPGWMNFDMFEAPNITCLYDCRKSLPLPDNSARGIFCEHVLEHMDYAEEVPRFLDECRRVLEPGGALRLIVPDAGRYLHAYCEGDWAPLEQLRSLKEDHVDPYINTRYETRMELINMVFRQDFEHKFAYDIETLHRLLERHGFSRVLPQRFGKSVMEGLAIDQPNHEAESLYMEAVK